MRLCVSLLTAWEQRACSLLKSGSPRGDVWGDGELSLPLPKQPADLPQHLRGQVRWLPGRQEVLITRALHLDGPRLRP